MFIAPLALHCQNALFSRSYVCRMMEEKAKYDTQFADSMANQYLVLTEQYGSAQMMGDAFRFKGLTLTHLDEIDSAEKYIIKASNIYNLSDDNYGNIYLCMLKGLQQKIMGNNLEAIEYYKNAIEYAYIFNDTYGLVRSNIYIGNLLIALGAVSDSRMYFRQAIVISEKAADTLLISSASNNIGYYYSNSANYDSAAWYQTRSLLIDLRNGFTENIARSLHNLGVVYSEWGKHEEAIACFNYALFYLHNGKDNALLAWCHYNLAVQYLDYNLIDAMKYQLAEARKYFLEQENIQGIGRCLFTYADYCYQYKKFDSALIYYDSVRVLSEQQKFYMDNAVLNNRIGSVLLDMKRIDEAEQYFMKGLAYSESIGNIHYIKDNVSGLALVYEYKRNFEKAYRYLRIDKSLQDSIFNERSQGIMAEMNASFNLERKQLQIDVLDNENRLALITIERNVNLIISLAALLIILVLFVTIISRQFRLKSSLKQLELSNKLFRSQMNPHFVFNALSSIQGFMYANDTVKASSYLADFSKLMRGILESSVNETITLDEEVSLMRHYLSLQQMRYNNSFSYEVIVNSECQEDWVLIPPMLAQPFIENAIEHGIKGLSYPGKVLVSYTVSGNAMTICIEDNGKGLILDESKSAHKSRATEITQKRLKQFTSGKQFVEAIRFENKMGKQGSGLIVSILIPIKID